jgi:hypothetical protein
MAMESMCATSDAGIEEREQPVATNINREKMRKCQMRRQKQAQFLIQTSAAQAVTAAKYRVLPGLDLHQSFHVWEGPTGGFSHGP